MSDGPNPDDFRAKVFRDRKHTEDWRVEKMDEDGSSEIAIFSGPDARERAIRYADGAALRRTWPSPDAALIARPTRIT